MAVPKKKHSRSRSNIRRNTGKKRRVEKLLQKARTSLKKYKRS